MGIVGGAIKRIDQPGVGAAALDAATLFGDNPMIGIVRANGTDNQRFAGPVNIGDEIGLALVFHVACVFETGTQERAGAVGQIDGKIKHAGLNLVFGKYLCYCTREYAMRKLIIMLAVLVVVAACGQTERAAEHSVATGTVAVTPTDAPPGAPGVTPTSGATSAPSATATPMDGPAQPTAQPTPTIVPMPPSTIAPVPAGEAPPDVVAPARAALASHLGVAESTLTLTSAMAQEWSDGSLGCPDPAKGYIQVIIPGYLLVFSADTQSYAIHTSVNATPLVLCEDGMPVILNAANSTG